MTYDESEIARLADVFQTAFADEAPRPDCPPAEKIWSAVREEVSPRELRRLLDHVAVCGLCTEAWLLAEELEAPHREPLAENEPATAPRGWLPAAVAAFGERSAAVGRAATVALGRQWLPAAVAAAMLVVAAGVAVQTRTGPPPTYRTIPDGEIELLTDTAGPVPREACRLRWSGPEGARYLVRVLHGFDVIEEVARLEHSEITVPPEKLSELPPGTRLDLYVEAYLPAERRSVARTFTFTLR